MMWLTRAQGPSECWTGPDAERRLAASLAILTDCRVLRDDGEVDRLVALIGCRIGSDSGTGLLTRPLTVSRRTVVLKEVGRDVKSIVISVSHRANGSGGCYVCVVRSIAGFMFEQKGGEV